MNDAMIELGRRAAACAEWEWLPGMRYVTPQGAAGRWVTMADLTDPTKRVLGVYQEDTYHHSQHEDKVPDLTDDATLGRLMGVVRRAYDEDVVICYGDGWWEVSTPTIAWEDDGTDSFAEALVCALEAAA